MLLAVSSAGAAPALGSSAWRVDPIWDDGNAEFCAYEIDWFRYGRLNPGRALMVLVKEPWAPDLDVKADRQRPDGFDVIKLNHIRDVPTGIYTYHQMASTFIQRRTGKLQKLAATSSEACGVSIAKMTGGRLETSSYFDGQGDRNIPYPADAAPDEIEVFPSLMAARYASLEGTTYSLERRSRAGVEVPAGRFDTFAVEAPHLLIEMSKSDGTVYRLSKCERIPYWTMNSEGGEAWLPERVR
jgi:hypothetical protein